MEGAKASSSRVQLIFVVLLVGAFAGANCRLTVVNFSQQPLQFYELTTPGQVVLSSGYEAAFAINPLPQLGQSTPNPEQVAVFTFITAPNATQNITGVREAFPILIASVYDNATITISESNTTNKVGFSVTYSS